MLTRALWLQVYVGAFGDEVVGTALQKLRKWCQHSKKHNHFGRPCSCGIQSHTTKHEKEENKQKCFDSA